MTRRLRECLFCETVEHYPHQFREHHPTGRRWDPDVVVSLCHDHHMIVHDDWYRAGVGPKVEPETWLHALAVTTRRWALLCGRLAREGVLCDLTEPLADWFNTHSERLDAIAMVSALDVLGEAWRSLGVFVRRPDCAGTDC